MGDTLVHDFWELFQGTTRAVGGNQGRAIHNPGPRPDADWFRHRLEGHLAGTLEPMGVYPCVQRQVAHAPTLLATPATVADNDLIPDFDNPLPNLKEEPNTVETVVHWGCIDWDQGYQESWPDAINTHNALKALGVTSWIERSRSKGWHLWVFADEWVPATVMRDALVAACQVVDAPIKEVNPKQTDVSDGKLGNYVRLPYPGWLTDPNGSDAQRVVEPQMHETEFFSLEWFVERALEERTPTHVLQELAARRTSVDRTRTDTTAPPIPTTQLDRALTRKLDGLAWTIFSGGPDGATAGDRSATLYKLVCRMWDTGRVTRDEAWAITCDADVRWGKYLERDDVDALWQTFTKAFQEQPERDEIEP